LKRPRSHTLEDESILYVSTLFAQRSWIVRRPVPDYGIDLEVEIVDATGNVTGSRFGIQLKAHESCGHGATIHRLLPQAT